MTIATSSPVPEKVARRWQAYRTLGALGHRGNQGSLMYTSDVYNKVDIVARVARSLLTDPTKTAKDVYYEVLTGTCKYIGLAEAISLPVTDASSLQDKITALLFLQRRVLPQKISASEAKSLRELVLSLPQETLRSLWNDFGVDAGTYCTYMPALLNSTPAKDPANLKTCLDKVIPHLVKEYRKMEFNEMASRPPLNFNNIILEMKTIMDSVRNGQRSLEDMIKVNEFGEAMYIDPKVPANALVA